MDPGPFHSDTQNTTILPRIDRNAANIWMWKLQLGGTCPGTPLTEARITAQQQEDKAMEIGTTLRGQAEERDHCECAQEGHSETGEALRCHKKKM